MRDFRDDLALIGPPEGCGYYVIYTRKDDAGLNAAIDRAIVKLVDSGRLRAIYEKYDIWNDAQKVLDARPPQAVDQAEPPRPFFDLDLLVRFGPSLVGAALTTIILSCTSDALGHDPRPARRHRAGSTARGLWPRSWAPTSSWSGGPR